jgi:N-methylhydantoinase B
MTEDKPALDPIGLEILSNALRSITDESFVALMKSAYSTNIKERHDHSTAITDPKGRLVVQAEESLPIHIASMMGLMDSLLGKFGGKVREGDIFVANDPHVAGGTHLPDINMAMPVFADGALVAFVCNIAHHAEVGGVAPGSMAGGMSEIYQEGLRIPVVRLFREGELQQDLFDLLLLNVRVPEERRGDYYAQIAACQLGRRRLLEVIESWSAATVTSAFDEIIQRTAARMRAAIAEIPDGTYRFEDVMDDDGLGTTMIPIRLEMTKTGDAIRFDFTGTAKQVAGNINVTMNATIASVCYGLKALLDPDVPNNEGMLDIPDIVAEKGTLLNAAFPAPVAARANTCQRIIDVVLGALAEAMPGRVVAAGNGANTTAVFAGTDPRTGRGYVYLETLGGGMGARPTGDGKDGVQVGITNTSNLPVEAIEMEYPLRVEEYSLVADSGGAGTYRGGGGLRRVVSPVGHDCLFNGAGERFSNRPWGLEGGRPGGSGQFILEGGAMAPRRLDDKPSGVMVAPDQRIVVETPGAGGWGDPGDRDRQALEADRKSGKFSDAWLRENYGDELIGDHEDD